MIAEGMCEMCGYNVAVRQKALIVDESREYDENILMLCPACHVMFESYLKPKIANALYKSGVQLTESWRTAITAKTAEKAADDLKNKAKKS